LEVFDKYVFNTTLDSENYIVRDHKVHGLCIMPGVTFLDMIYRGLRNKGVDTSNIVLKNILFLNPISIKDEEKKQIRITITKDNEHGSIIAESKLVLNDEWITNLQAEINFEEKLEMSNLPVLQLIESSSKCTDMDKAYAFARSMHIQHDEFMKALGEIFVGENYLLAKISPSNLAKEYLDEFYLHPVYLDSSTIVPGYKYSLENRQYETAIPIYIDTFYAKDGLQEDTYYIYIRNEQCESPSEDVIFTCITIYNKKGEEIARMDKLTSKRVRSKDLTAGKDIKEEATAKTIIVKTENKEKAFRKEITKEEIQNELRQMVASHMNTTADKISIKSDFYEQGLNSIGLIGLVKELEACYDDKFYPTLLFEYINIEELSNYLLEGLKGKVKTKNNEDAVKKEPTDVSAQQLYYYEPVLEEIEHEVSKDSFKESILYFVFDKNISKNLVKEKKIFVIENGDGFHKLKESLYTADLYSKEQLQDVLNNVREKSGLPSHMVYILPNSNITYDLSGQEHFMKAGIEGLLAFSQAFSALKEKKNVKMLIVFQKSAPFDNPYYEGLEGLVKTINKENELLEFKILILDKKQDILNNREIFINELLDNEKEKVYYQQGKRYATRFSPVLFEDKHISAFRDKGVYIITGGMGGLGRSFAEHIARKVKSTLILVGRSSLNEEKEKFIERLKGFGADVIYEQVDLGNVEKVNELISKIKNLYGSIHGVIHSAGVLRDSVYLAQTKKEIYSILNGKVIGMIALDEALKEEPIDFFVTFSSITALTGNIGQCIYAYANGFMDSYMRVRNKLVENHKRSGKSISVNWPLWKNGGMQVDSQTQFKIESEFKLALLKNEEGIQALELILASDKEQILVISGNEKTLKAVGLSEVADFGAIYEKHEIITISDEMSINSIDETNSYKREDIAIIGVSGQYPMARDLEQFWNNLQQGKNCIKEVPKERWNNNLFFNADKKSKGTTYSKWGGFLDTIAEFDPLFFNISPKEAELMDPQERLFLETVWNTIEDAGYTKKQLNQEVGVFVGVMWGQYQLLGADEIHKGNVVNPSSFFASIANHVSYWFNFIGPSMAVDTMCSSSLTAVHLACESIFNKECEVAIAGGVNVMIHPSKYLFLSTNKMCSSEGLCRAFGEGGDGYVPGEGVGAILLKPLRKAIEDKDQIYGVIKGSSLNHGGKTSGFSVPSPKSQAKVIRDSYIRAGINPKTISYIEAHGTGTSLGDPIEISGLSKVFLEYTDKTNFCSIGSVKTNIGHLESAAGIAGITKILLQMKHKQLVPSLHSSTLNCNIDFEHSAFQVQQELEDWKCPIFEEEEKYVTYPRRAGISGFGAGGSNAHIIIEEYNNDKYEEITDSGNDVLFVLSAKDNDDLQKYIKKYVEFLQEQVKDDKAFSLEQMTYMLQMRREHMHSRLAIIVNNISDLIKKLKHIITGQQGMEDIELKKGDLLYQLAKDYIEHKKVDFSILYIENKMQAMTLPTYPFKNVEYWLPQVEEPKLQSKKLHALLDSNISTLKEQCFLTTLTGNEYYIKDHIIDNKKVLPGAVLLEMAKAAGELGKGKKVKTINNFIWHQAVIFEDFNKGKKLVTSLYPEKDQVYFVIYDVAEKKERTKIASGSFEFYNSNQEDIEKEKTLNLDEIQKRCTKEISITEAYNAFSKIGIVYGSKLRCMRQIKRSDKEALVLLNAPNKYEDDLKECENHPIILDNAFQSICALKHEKEESQYLPYKIQNIDCRKKVSGEVYVYLLEVSVDNESKVYNIMLLDKNGLVLMELGGFTVRISKRKNEILYFKKVEKVSPIVIDEKQMDKEKHTLLLFDSDTVLQQQMINQSIDVILVLKGKSFEVNKEGIYIINPSNNNDFELLYEELYKDNQIPSNIVYHWYQNSSNELSVFDFMSLIKNMMKWKQDKKWKIITLYSTTNNPYYNALNGAFSGFGKSTNLENSQFTFKTVGYEPKYTQYRQAQIILEEILSEDAYNQEVIYKNNIRYIYALERINREENHKEIDFSKKTYLITGGAGGLGVLFAKYLCKKGGVRLILCGRSPITEKKEELLAQIKENDSIVIYKQVDICDKSQVLNIVNEVKNQFGKIDGVIHCAGAIHDSLLRNKSKDDFEKTIAPKIYGTRVLDDVLRNESLEFFVLFSSLASLAGNIGQADYAYANSFLDYFAKEREEKRLSGECSGKTVSINWPLWSDGGMQMNEQAINSMKKNSGIDLLESRYGFEAFEYALANAHSQLLVLEGECNKIQYRLENGTKKSKKADNRNITDKQRISIREFAIQYLTVMIANEIKIPAESLSHKDNFEKYGIDSIIIMNITEKLEEQFGELSKTLFFENQTIEQLADYFVNNYTSTIEGLIGIDHKYVSEEVEEADVMVGERFSIEDNEKNNELDGSNIAIIGISGQYPMADNLQEFWENLKDGRDCIDEIPKDRWDKDLFFDENKRQSGKSYGKWGGFLNDIDKFDALLFHISPKEAELIDPQERLFLQCAWNTLEDAGYSCKALEKNKVGVFVGVMYGQYQLLGIEESTKGNYLTPSSSYASIANRASYYFNFKGPSMAVDTMCSSSLTALHLACCSIQKGESDVALAGGVNICVHPSKYLQLSEGNFLSTDGRCNAFGANGTGYVPGEGVGSVLLKPLKQAIADGDHIYGVIKSSAVNHGGKTNGYTVPNPNLQCELVKDAIKKAGIEPQMISYIEAHGTGTSLGDPIEIVGLQKAFGPDVHKQSCSIGSVKSNIGHLESCAGMAALTKVLLQMKYKMLVPSLHSEELNSNIRFDQTPFYVQQELQDWNQTILKVDGIDKTIPRIAGISAFGAGGSNAHVIIEEYQDTTNVFEDETEHIFVLSARNEERLIIFAKKLIEYIEYTSDKYTLSQLAYTLQVGKEYLDDYLAIVAATKEELLEKLVAFVNGKKNISEIYYGNKRKHSKKEELLLEDAEGEQYIEMLIQSKKLGKIAKMWVQGVTIPWERFYKTTPKRLSLPTYPFEKQVYWLPKAIENKRENMDNMEHSEPYELLDKNISDFEGIKYSKTLTGNESYVKDHYINNQMILPGAAFLEMALEAGELALHEAVTSIKEVIWSSPIQVEKNNNKKVQIGLYNCNEDFLFQVWTDNEVHAQGLLVFKDTFEELKYDLTQIKMNCKTFIEKEAFYADFANGGFNYGTSLKCIQDIFTCNNEVLARFEVPKGTDNEQRPFLVNPGILDSVFQTVSTLIHNEKIWLPYAVGEIEFHQSLSSKGYIYARKLPVSQEEGELVFDIYILDENGVVVATIKKFEMKSVMMPNAQEIAALKTVCHHTEWEKRDLYLNEIPPMNHIIVFEQKDNILNYGEEEKRNLIFVYPGESFNRLGNMEYEVNPINQEDYICLFDELAKDNMTVDEIMCLWGIDRSKEPDSCEDNLNYSIYAMFALTKAMALRKNMNLNLVYVTGEENTVSQAFGKAIAGYFKTVALEYPKWNMKVVEVIETILSDRQTYSRLLWELSEEKLACQHIRLNQVHREVLTLKESPLLIADSASSMIRQHGVYVITGGFGGLGYIFAEYLAKNACAKLVLIGSSELNTEKRKKLESLKSLTKDVIYVKADIANQIEVKYAIEEARKNFGSINGILHSAGVLRDCVLDKKKKEDLQAVINPKIWGAIWLDEFTKNEKLDWFCTFSSTTAVLGNIGQSDYAYANSFIDEFINARNEKQENHTRFGKSLSINWPLWKDGGMQVDEQTLSILKRQIGLEALPTELGINLFNYALSTGEKQIMFMYGNKVKLANLLHKKDEKPIPVFEESTKQFPLSDVSAMVLKEIIESVCEILKVSKKDVFEDTEFSELGFDSVSFASFGNSLNDRLDIDLAPSIFFEYTNVSSLLKYILQEYKEKLVNVESTQEERKETPNETYVVNNVKQQAALVQKKKLPKFFMQQKTKEFNNEDIAIIGMSGKMPQSDDLEEFWDNIASERNLITKIPKDRWNVEDCYGDPEMEDNKTNIKWGGFLKAVNEFDATFFGILPREAELMDPQQRLFLETVWKTIEDAGYKVSDLSGSNTGLFVGVASSDYKDVLNENNIDITAQSSTGMSHAMLANRISYLFNWHGPSEPIDTACSSSLVAIHNAIKAINAGECDMAIAGGVNVMLSPTLFVSFNKAGMLSKDGKCKAFDEKADGYVRGEGVGAVLLKPLSKALADKEHIYAVIKGSSINHGGKANSLTSPNPNAQAELIYKAYKNAEIDIDTVTYIEAHGTGTSLGDPIEINGLKKAFEMLRLDKNTRSRKEAFCGIGSIKTNVGHLEAAAGMAGLFKILLAMKYKRIPASINFNKLNPYITLEDSPFYLVEHTKEWEREKTSQGIQIPRRAGISSFGFGGVNAHIVLEEYMEDDSIIQDNNKQKLIILSAKDENRIFDYARQILDFIDRNESIIAQKNFLSNLAFTLQQGREEMEERVAFIANSISELKEKLNQFVQQQDTTGIFRGNGIDSKLKKLFAGDEGKLFIESIVQKGLLDKLGELWVNGFEVDWSILSKNENLKKISLPTYPFAKDVYWVKKSNKHDTYKNNEILTPLLDDVNLQACMDKGVVFNKKLASGNLILEHHIVNGQKVFPGVGYLEMAYEAISRLYSVEAVRITDVTWQQPMYVGLEKNINLVLQKNEDNFYFEVVDSSNQQHYALGYMDFQIHQDQCHSVVDVEQVYARCNKSLDNRELYKKFASAGLKYGPFYQIIQQIQWNEEEAISRIELVEGFIEGLDQYGMHPAIMDGALQTIAGLWENKEDSSTEIVVPFAVERVERINRLTSEGYAYVKKINEDKYNIALLDGTGKVCVVFYGVCIRALKYTEEKADKGFNMDFSYLPMWRPVISKGEEDR